MATWTGVQPHTEGRVIWKKMHQKEVKQMYNSETKKKGTSPGDSGIRSAPLFIIRPWSLCLHCRIGDFCHATGSDWCWGFWQWHSNPAWRMSQAQGICIQTTLTHLNIHPEQCWLVRTVRVCYANGTECTWHYVFISNPPLSEGSLIFQSFLPANLLYLLIHAHPHPVMTKASHLTGTSLILFAQLVILHFVQNVTGQESAFIATQNCFWHTLLFKKLKIIHNWVFIR